MLNQNPPLTADMLDQAELQALLAFYRDAGVEWMVEDQPIDHKAAFANRQAAVAAPQTGGVTQPEKRTRPGSERREPPVQAARPMIVPDDQAVLEAGRVAASANSIAELARAFSAFDGCNLKSSARSTAFVGGNLTSELLVIGPVASAEDDREGQPFSGPAGALLDRMLKAIDLDRDRVLLSQIVPWRPPGSRGPRADETDLCRPFTERLLALAAPRAVLLLGNYTARTLIDPNGSIHALRGRWFDLAAGNRTVPAIATFHPADLIQAPLNKGLAWRDLLMFRMAIAGPVAP